MKEQSGYLSRQKNFIFLFFWLVSISVSGQSFPSPVGARSWGTGNAMVARLDFTAIVNNVAGIAGLHDAVIFSGFDSYYGFESLNTISFGAAIPISNDLSTGFSIQRFGDKLYSDLALGIGAGHRIGRVSLGIKVNYLQNAINAPTLILTRKALSVEFGGIVQFSSEFSFGAHVSNVTQSSYSGDYGNKVPTSLRAGFVYIPLKTVHLSLEMDKNTDLPVSVKFGLEYQVWKQLYLRTGLASKPLTNHFGAGFKGGKFYVDYAVHTHPQLGWSHHFSLGYELWKQEVKD